MHRNLILIAFSSEQRAKERKRNISKCCMVLMEKRKKQIIFSTFNKTKKAFKLNDNQTERMNKMFVITLVKTRVKSIKERTHFQKQQNTHIFTFSIEIRVKQERHFQLFNYVFNFKHNEIRTRLHHSILITFRTIHSNEIESIFPFIRLCYECVRVFGCLS